MAKMSLELSNYFNELLHQNRHRRHEGSIFCHLKKEWFELKVENKGIFYRMSRMVFNGVYTTDRK